MRLKIIFPVVTAAFFAAFCQLAAGELALYDAAGGSVCLQRAWMQLLAERNDLSKAGTEITVKTTAEFDADLLDEKSAAIIEQNVKVDEKRFVRQLCAVLPVVVAVPANCPLDNISLSDLQRIYCGKVTSWARLGGSETTLRVAGSPAGSPVYRAFMSLVMHRSGSDESSKLIRPGMLELDNPEGSIALLQALPGVIVFGGWELAEQKKKNYKLLKINNVYPDKNNVVSGAYLPAMRFDLIFTQKISGEDAKKIKEFFKSAVKSEKNLLLVEDF